MDEGHSYGPTCALHESEDENSTPDDDPPKIKAQFFYASSLPIDDPLSPVPQIHADQFANQPPQPFSSRDNAALEETWQDVRRHREEFKVRPGSRGLNRMFSFPKFQSGQILTPELTSPIAESSGFAFPTVPDFGTLSRNGTPRPRKSSRKASSRSQSPTLTRKQSERATKGAAIVASEAEVMLDQEPVIELVSRRNTVTDTAEDIAQELDLGSVKRKKHRSPLRNRRKNGSDVSPPIESTIPEDTTAPEFDSAATHSQIALEAESTISGKPFARAPSTRQIMSRMNGASPLASPRPERFGRQPPFIQAQELTPPQKEIRKAFVPVGVSRLHLVEFPDLTMKPIYWSPINDASHVIRATWFFKDSMLPVPADVANRLEIGYEDMKPYAPTYQDELDACIEHGAAAELKVVHRLWPEQKTSRPSSALQLDGTDEEKTKEQLPEDADNVAVDLRILDASKRMFQSYSVVYIDSKNAKILRPNALPSVSRNRRPLNAIRKGRELGVAVVRGFDKKRWQKLHPDLRESTKATHARLGAQMSQSGAAATRARRASCHICDDTTSRSKVTDLVLVIHGIGQKLSERVDSYHFTHAINGLRREFNVELSKENVRGSLKDETGIMVLPVNWRLGLSFDDDYKGKDAENKYEMKDITPETLPAIRSLVSDVMLDIPYYMSHHKQKMISAVVREANRVYRLWCKNNPGFQETGRVHLIAHSLGSAMAMDILSSQPTHLPPDLDLTDQNPSDTIFEFDTTNLFCCGSPAGFFLLLHSANLVPRRGRNKPGMQHGEDQGQGVASDIPGYGCLAVHNLYNILHRNDPIAYQQNACVDSQYASLLEPATIPSATFTLFQRLSTSLTFRPAARRGNSDAYGNVKIIRPGIAHLPSTVELETHNFTREEIAEKRMYLLNDNGQIDYFLNSGGGPLEIQYLNMLSAHSSYWILPDFVRFLVVEIGRKPGREETLSVLRARKKVVYRRGEF